MIIIPAYNEAESIEGVISAVKKELPDAGIVVINDGSVDATSSIAKGLGVRVVDMPYNMGIGAAMQTGY
ncbi:MAG: glycosyltransferase, partial [Deltaproteobacteria bacterium]